VKRNQTKPLTPPPPAAANGHVPRHDELTLQLHNDTSPRVFLADTQQLQLQQQQLQPGQQECESECVNEVVRVEMTSSERNPDIETLGELETDNDTSGLLTYSLYSLKLTMTITDTSNKTVN